MSKVLILESDLVLAQNVASVLDSSGIKSVISADPQSAIDEMDQNKISVIVMEVILAGRSGIEFLYELRSYPEWRDVPVIIFSQVNADDIAISRNSLEELGVTHCIYKPNVTLAELTRVVKELLPALKA